VTFVGGARSRLARLRSARARHAARAAVVLLAAAGLVAGVGTVVGRTAAQWSDPAYITTTASAGTWVVAPVNKCEVRYQADDHLVPARPCTVTFDAIATWAVDTGWARWVASAPGIANNEYIAFTVTVPAAGLYAGWTWSHTQAALGAGTLVASCSLPPVFNGRLQANIGATPQIYLTFTPSPQACA